MKDSNHKPNNDSAKIDVSVYIEKIDHLNRMLEMVEYTSRLRKEHIDHLENKLKDIARHKFVFLS